MLKIVTASKAGFCFGVREAVKTAARRAGANNCYLLGNIVHNKTVVDGLAEKGLKIIESVDELPALKEGERGSVIIRDRKSVV